MKRTRNTQTRTLKGHQMTVAQTREVRRLWRNGAISVQGAELTGRGRIMRSLLKRGIVLITPSGKEYILDHDATLDIAIWLRDHAPDRF